MWPSSRGSPERWALSGSGRWVSAPGNGKSFANEYSVLFYLAKVRLKYRETIRLI